VESLDLIDADILIRAVVAGIDKKHITGQRVYRGSIGCEASANENGAGASRVAIRVESIRPDRIPYILFQQYRR
jgi:hypothetical protein